ncbi:hypothetical protein CCAX7_58550 [Capsulimonas corticalis]|uniref:Uncharacterized protein n=1 Tax=Capsulimonas corticalis TaxID=2219043 RepID=A0A9N7QCU6_9BACT|nr:hypothetical protein CCAX7_58550 [Capsulimonas corticalis]
MPAGDEIAGQKHDVRFLREHHPHGAPRARERPGMIAMKIAELSDPIRRAAARPSGNRDVRFLDDKVIGFMPMTPQIQPRPRDNGAARQ